MHILYILLKNVSVCLSVYVYIIQNMQICAHRTRKCCSVRVICIRCELQLSTSVLSHWILGTFPTALFWEIFLLANNRKAPAMQWDPAHLTVPKWYCRCSERDHGPVITPQRIRGVGRWIIEQNRVHFTYGVQCTVYTCTVCTNLINSML